MSHRQRHIKSQSNTTYEELYAISEPTTATFISTEIMETNEEETGVQQTSKFVPAESELA